MSSNFQPLEQLSDLRQNVEGFWLPIDRTDVFYFSPGTNVYYNIPSGRSIVTHSLSEIPYIVYNEAEQKYNISLEIYDCTYLVKNALGQIEIKTGNRTLEYTSGLLDFGDYDHFIVNLDTGQIGFLNNIYYNPSSNAKYKAVVKYKGLGSYLRPSLLNDFIQSYNMSSTRYVYDSSGPPQNSPVKYELGTIWVDESGKKVYILSNRTDGVNNYIYSWKYIDETFSEMSSYGVKFFIGTNSDLLLMRNNNLIMKFSNISYPSYSTMDLYLYTNSTIGRSGFLVRNASGLVSIVNFDSTQLTELLSNIYLDELLFNTSPPLFYDSERRVLYHSNDIGYKHIPGNHLPGQVLVATDNSEYPYGWRYIKNILVNNVHLSANKFLKCDKFGNLVWSEIKEFPDGGQSGQLLFKGEDSTYVWEYFPENRLVPLNGKSGQILTLNDRNEVVWDDIVRVPGYGLPGQFLCLTDLSSLSYRYIKEVPVTNDLGKILVSIPSTFNENSYSGIWSTIDTTTLDIKFSIDEETNTGILSINYNLTTPDIGDNLNEEEFLLLTNVLSNVQCVYKIYLLRDVVSSPDNYDNDIYISRNHFFIGNKSDSMSLFFDSSSNVYSIDRRNSDGLLVSSFIFNFAESLNYNYSSLMLKYNSNLLNNLGILDFTSFYLFGNINGDTIISLGRCIQDDKERNLVIYADPIGGKTGLLISGYLPIVELSLDVTSGLFIKRFSNYSEYLFSLMDGNGIYLYRGDDFSKENASEIGYDKIWLKSNFSGLFLGSSKFIEMGCDNLTGGYIVLSSPSNKKLILTANTRFFDDISSFSLYSEDRNFLTIYSGNGIVLKYTSYPDLIDATYDINYSFITKNRIELNYLDVDGNDNSSYIKIGSNNGIVICSKQLSGSLDNFISCPEFSVSSSLENDSTRVNIEIGKNIKIELSTQPLDSSVFSEYSFKLKDIILSHIVSNDLDMGMFYIHDVSCLSLEYLNQGDFYSSNIRLRSKFMHNNSIIYCNRGIDDSSFYIDAFVSDTSEILGRFISSFNHLYLLDNINNYKFILSLDKSGYYNYNKYDVRLIIGNENNFGIDYGIDENEEISLYIRNGLPNSPYIGFSLLDNTSSIYVGDFDDFIHSNVTYGILLQTDDGGNYRIFCGNRNLSFFEVDSSSLVFTAKRTLDNNWEKFIFDGDIKYLVRKSSSNDYEMFIFLGEEKSNFYNGFIIDATSSKIYVNLPMFLSSTLNSLDDIIVSDSSYYSRVIIRNENIELRSNDNVIYSILDSSSFSIINTIDTGKYSVITFDGLFLNDISNFVYTGKVQDSTDDSFVVGIFSHYTQNNTLRIPNSFLFVNSSSKTSGLYINYNYELYNNPNERGISLTFIDNNDQYSLRMFSRYGICYIMDSNNGIIITNKGNSNFRTEIDETSIVFFQKNEYNYWTRKIEFNPVQEFILVKNLEESLISKLLPKGLYLDATIQPFSRNFYINLQDGTMFSSGIVNIFRANPMNYILFDSSSNYKDEFIFRKMSQDDTNVPNEVFKLELDSNYIRKYISFYSVATDTSSIDMCEIYSNRLNKIRKFKSSNVEMVQENYLQFADNFSFTSNEGSVTYSTNDVTVFSSHESISYTFGSIFKSNFEKINNQSRIKLETLLGCGDSFLVPASILSIGGNSWFCFLGSDTLGNFMFSSSVFGFMFGSFTDSTYNIVSLISDITSLLNFISSNHRNSFILSSGFFKPRVFTYEDLTDFINIHYGEGYEENQNGCMFLLEDNNTYKLCVFRDGTVFGLNFNEVIYVI